MARIISGQEERDPSFALMKGLEMGRQFSAARRAKEDQQNEQARLMLSIQRAMQQRNEQEAKALGEANRRAQLGDAQAMQQQVMIAQAANQPPEQKMLQEFTGILGHITDPKARELAVKTFDDYSKKLEEHKQGEAADAAIKAAASDGLIDEGVFRQRRESGERPQDLTQEISKMRHDQTIQAMAQGKSAEAITQAQELVSKAPKTNSRLMAEYALTAFQNSPTAQGKPDAGPKLLQQIQRELVLSDQEKKDLAEAQRQKAHRAGPASDKYGTQVFPPGGVKGAFSSPPDQPETPAMESFTSGLKAEKEKRYPGSTKASKTAGVSLPTSRLRKAKSSLEITKILQEEGIPLTPEIGAQVQNLRSGSGR